MDEFKDALKIKDLDYNEMIKIYNSLPNDSILKDSLFIGLCAVRRIIKRGFI